MEYLIVDGYNIINAWGDVFDLSSNSLEECRNKLLNILSNYQGYKKINIIVVFDAHLVKGSQLKKEIFDNLTVVFTKENETADNYIERFVYRFGSTNRIKVATSDYLEQTMVLRYGGIRVSARELREEVKNAGQTNRPEVKDYSAKTNSLMANVKPELLEKLEKIRRSKF
ncbi:MAG: NYN domain-containing protein [Clostridia bacterium]|nr:NYN domain-containing protein [Clostridia bacterium]